MAILGGYLALHHSLKSSLESTSPQFDAISLVISLDLTLLILYFSGFPSKSLFLPLVSIKSIVSSQGFHRKYCLSHFIIHYRSTCRIQTYLLPNSRFKGPPLEHFGRFKAKFMNQRAEAAAGIVGASLQNQSQAIQQLQSKTTPQQLAIPTTPITHSAPMDIFERLILDLDTEGRYLFLNVVSNQLRYPNNHTHYFSCVLLYLFAEANQEIIQEQITRVLLERLIVNRPHPWGLLITFIEIIKNLRYNFWNHRFMHHAPEIEKLFDSVARSCMGQPMKLVEDGIASSISTERNH